LRRFRVDPDEIREEFDAAVANGRPFFASYPGDESLGLFDVPPMLLKDIVAIYSDV
jgi:hypothetical protein